MWSFIGLHYYIGLYIQEKKRFCILREMLETKCLRLEKSTVYTHWIIALKVANGKYDKEQGIYRHHHADIITNIWQQSTQQSTPDQD